MKDASWVLMDKSRDESLKREFAVDFRDTGGVYPIVLSGYGKEYAVVSIVTSSVGKLLWLNCYRYDARAKTRFDACLTPEELMEMECGMSDDGRLGHWIRSKYVDGWDSSYIV